MPVITSPRITIDQVRTAARRLDGIAHRTPVLTSRTLDTMVGGRLFLKAENFQRAGAFKFRGAYNAVTALDPKARGRGVLGFSSGNHAQALALAAHLHGVPATLVMPSDAPASKLAATRGYGAEVVTYDRYTEDRAAIGARLADQRGATLIPPYDHPDVIAGAGTTALELIEEVGELDMLLVCTGGGGLLAGCAIAARALLPGIEIIGVEPAAGDDWHQSLACGERVRMPEVPRTIADGQQTEAPGELTFPIVQRFVSGIALVSDAEIIAGMSYLFERLKIVVEPSGASAFAAVLAGQVNVTGKRVGITISGGNIAVDRFAALVTGTPALQ